MAGITDYIGALGYGNLQELAGPVLIVYFLIAIWSLIWKGFALWKAGRLNQRTWFIILLIVNTLGILEILYLFVFSKKSSKTQKP